MTARRRTATCRREPPAPRGRTIVFGFVPGPRRDPGGGRARRAALPRRGPALDGRVPRRQHVLRPVRVPHHLAPPRGVDPTPHHPTRASSGPGGPGACCRPSSCCWSVWPPTPTSSPPRASSPRLRLDSLSTLFYVANWHFIVGGSNYFAQSAQPSPLSHMWSLAIEEQFYIVWPPVVLVLLHLGRRLRPSRQLWPVLAAAVVGVLASAADMRWSYLHHAPVTRLYEGTDTRCQDILVGAVLAIGLTMWARHRRALPLPVPDLADLELARIHPSAGTVGLGAPPTRRRDAPRQRGPSAQPIAAWELASTTTRLAAQVFGWAALARPGRPVGPARRSDRIPVRRRRAGRGPGRRRGHLRGGHRPGGQPVPGAGQPGLRLRRARSPTASTSGTSRCSPC